MSAHADNGATPVAPPVDGPAYTTENHFWIYTSPAILMFGLCTNVLTVIVLRRRALVGTSANVYLTMLAVGDLTVLLAGLLPEWLHQLHVVSLWELHPWVCRAEMYVYYTSLDFAIWTLMLFSCDRCLAVCRPLNKAKYSTPKRAVIACGLAFAVANLNGHVFWSRGAVYSEDGALVGNCRYLTGFQYFELSVRPLVVLTAAFILPFGVIAVSNGIIVSRMAGVRRMRGKHAKPPAGQRMRTGLTQTTLMCLSASVAFLILVLPSIVLFIGKRSWSSFQWYWLLKAVANQLVYVHHSINFVLYSLTGRRFRRELYLMFKGQRSRSTGSVTSKRFGSLSETTVPLVRVGSLQPNDKRTASKVTEALSEDAAPLDSDKG